MAALLLPDIMAGKIIYRRCLIIYINYAKVIKYTSKMIRGLLFLSLSAKFRYMARTGTLLVCLVQATGKHILTSLLARELGIRPRKLAPIGS